MRWRSTLHRLRVLGYRNSLASGRQRLVVLPAQEVDQGAQFGRNSAPARVVQKQCRQARTPLRQRFVEAELIEWKSLALSTDFDV